jgi:hypothetical protein
MKSEFTIYRKPMQTDIIIPKDSCQPHEHKISSINYLINRVNIYPIIKKVGEKELTIIQDTLQNNEYNNEVSARQLTPHKHKKTEIYNNKRHKWSIFTHSRI